MVLDASALIALMREETGAERVAREIDHTVIGAVNLAEVTSKFVREGIAIGVVQEWVETLELEVRPFDRELACADGALLPAIRGAGTLPRRSRLSGARAYPRGDGAHHGPRLARRGRRRRDLNWLWA